MLGSSARVASGNGLGQICVSHTQRRPRHECNQDTTDVMTATAVWHFSKSFCKNEVRLSSQVRIRPRLRGKSTRLFCHFNTSVIEPHPFPDGAFQKLRRRLLLPLPQTMTSEHVQFDGVKTGEVPPQRNDADLRGAASPSCR